MLYSSVDQGLNTVMEEIHRSSRFKKLKTKHRHHVGLRCVDKSAELIMAHAYVYIKVLCLG